ncbi:hypothetical protein [Streptomyces huiliensis]|uniref:hypothetical protein n=1 Tax=Streptomyces huiliensis TaxID=2876027 RepID=UPI001CBAA836|nr:hypothetical protein [Streptomyces huiliensis]MBZ4324276.1 hypothetical protein [Streptomyces huiliensis]
MSVQQLPASVRRAGRALQAAAGLAVAAAGVIVIDQAVGGGLAERLRQSYPQRSADQIGMAESSILTYLFTLGVLGVCLFAAMAWAIRRGRRWARGIGSTAVVLGSVLAVYNFSQPHPLVMTVAGVVPCVAGLAAVLLLRTRESASYFSVERKTSA